MKKEQNLNEPQTLALNIPVVKNCTTCKYTKHRYTESKCSKCSREFSMWKQR